MLRLKQYLRNVNWALVVASVLLTIIGIICIQSADLHDPYASGEAHKQILYAFIGFGLMIGVSRVDYRNWERWAPWLYGLNLVLLLFILRGGHSALGAQRWISLGPLGTFQPSEPAKLVLAISIAVVLTRWECLRLRDLWRPLVTVAIPALLILKQPDLGTTLVVLAMLSAQLFFGLRDLRIFLAYAGGVAAACLATVSTNLILKPFQKARLLVFLNPKADLEGAGYNLNQSKIAVGNGELLGRGLHRGTQTQLNFVPEHSRDFIFTVLAEEMGFIGAVGLIALYAVMLFGGIRTMFVARDRFGFLLATGIVAMFTFHIMVNVGMTIGIMPITGIPLPFMSYGGSAIFTDFIALGILLNIYAQKDRDVLGNA